jgi:hypothetical protein
MKRRKTLISLRGSSVQNAISSMSFWPALDLSVYNFPNSRDIGWKLDFTSVITLYWSPSTKINGLSTLVASNKVYLG